MAQKQDGMGLAYSTASYIYHFNLACSWINGTDGEDLAFIKIEQGLQFTW